MPQASRAAPGRRRGIALLLALGLAGLGIVAGAAERLVPHQGKRYLHRQLGFMIDLPDGVVACQRPREDWREGIVIVLGRAGSCDAVERGAAFVNVTGEPNTEALGDVESLAASICNDPRFGEARVAPARRAIDTLKTMSCMLQDENGSVIIEAMAQNVRRGPPATWTNLRVTLVAPGDRWPEFTRAFEEVVGRVRRLP